MAIEFLATMRSSIFEEKILRTFLLAAISIAVSIFSSATAQEINEYLTVGLTADWVELIDRPNKDFVLGNGRDINYLLVDKQLKYSDTDAERYARYVEQLLSPNAVERSSTISVDFDPAYQTVAFHRLLRIRDGEEADILDPSRFDLFRIETDREKLIYNGTLQLSYLIPDVRVGDVLDYSFTVSGKNPAIGPHYVSGFQHGFGVAVQRHFQRVLFPSEPKIHVKTLGETEPPKISQIGEMTEYAWDRWDVAPVIAEADTPPSHFAFPTTLFSTFDSWQAVGSYFSPFYDVTNMNSDELQKIASDIRSEHQDPSAQLRSALEFVQREIRYLGIELGEGGYIPRQPEEVLRNRFGDCKDMTLLLIALLAELDIEAVPFLVSMENTDAIDAYIPSHGAFDHIVVSATLNGRTYILDPTRGVQLGDLEHLQQGNFGKGLVVAEHGPGMIDAPVPAPDFWKDITDTYDIVSDPDAVLLTSVSKYRMGQADWMLAWYSRDGAAAVEKSFLEYFQNFFPQLEQIGELDLDVDKDAAEIAITVNYRIPDAWQEDTAPGTQYFYTQADDALQDIPTFVGATRTMPFKLPHPVRTRQTQKFLLDNTWAIDNDYELISMPAFTFSRTEDFTNDLYSVAVTYETNSNKISAEDFGDTMAAIRNARNLVGVSLTVTDNIQQSPIETWLTESEDVETTIFLWQMATIFLSLIIALALVRRENIVLAEQIYHPISMTKFLVMSSVSLGIYPIFWVYMNWRWIQKVDSEDVSPGWRTFFMALTNFSLFKKMARKPGGVGWFRYAEIPLAGIILIGAISERYYNKVPEAPDWLFLFGLACILAWLPAVAHVNKLNQGHPSSLRRNSKFGWTAFGMLALFFPVFGLIVYGYF